MTGEEGLQALEGQQVCRLVGTEIGTLTHVGDVPRSIQGTPPRSGLVKPRQ